MRKSPLLLFLHAFSVTIGNPTQCDDLPVSWTGGQAPFQILVTAFDQPLYNISVPASAFSNGKGSYSISQFPFTTGTQFLLTMSDNTGFGTGGTSTVLTVGSPVANNNCNITSPSLDFCFSTASTIQQCNDYTFSGYDDAVLPVTITGLIPGGTSVILYPVTTSNYTWVADVKEGTSLLFFMTDSQGRDGGVDNLKTVADSTDASCLNAISPSSTSSAPSQTSSQSNSSGTSSSTSAGSSGPNVGIIAGAAVGGGVLLVLSITLVIYYRQKASRGHLQHTSAGNLPSPLIQTQHGDQRFHIERFFTLAGAGSALPRVRTAAPADETGTNQTTEVERFFVLAGAGSALPRVRTAVPADETGTNQTTEVERFFVLAGAGSALPRVRPAAPADEAGTN
ncbi:hypothetical protein K503DRAFT_828531 [Rhizopogon vinicolor AM-OR11-026]|uniref:Mid2 domain-containing protein n=1 Tax=Rhizopogon vinicolor AM-OR11-026 TaxID=1314800 RepID=A0A1B7MSS5_9AGAM|nr:hypothetical protein K503DRAFT_828531 [Rhizopogon vinicolor AM-OR11-026]